MRPTWTHAAFLAVFVLGGSVLRTVAQEVPWVVFPDPQSEAACDVVNTGNREFVVLRDTGAPVFTHDFPEDFVGVPCDAFELWDDDDFDDCLNTPPGARVENDGCGIVVFQLPPVTIRMGKHFDADHGPDLWHSRHAPPGTTAACRNTVIGFLGRNGIA